MGNFWDSLNSDQKRAFKAMAHKRVFAAGARLMREGEEADHVAVILSGLTEIRIRENGAERVVAERGPGQLIGERAALEISVRSATVVALQTVVALVMRTADFAGFISTYPAVLKIVEEQIYLRLREGPAGSDQRHDVPGEVADDWLAPERSGARPPLLAGQNCTVIRTDVVAFGADDRTEEARRIIRRALPAMTRAALGTAWDTCRPEDRGDGLLVIVAPGIPTARVIDRLVTVLPHELKRHNRIYRDPVRIQLRVAVEVGPIEEDGVGTSGKSIIQAARMLDAPAFKQAIAGQRAVFGLVVSPFVYDSYVVGGDGYADPVSYVRIPVHVKETRAAAWMLLMDQAGRIVPPRDQLMRRAGPDGHFQLVISGASSPCSRV